MNNQKRKKNLELADRYIGSICLKSQKHTTFTTTTFKGNLEGEC